MSKWTGAMTTAMELSSAASEEATRAGSPEVDVDHLFLALVLSGGAAGDLLRSYGVTIDAARTAIDAEQTDQLASLGISAPDVTPRQLTPAYQTRLDWTPRAREVLKRTSSPFDGLALLRGVITERSGTVTRLLRRLDVDLEPLLERLFQEPASPAQRTDSSHAGRRGIVCVTGFIPAPLDDVWAVVNDPARIPEWDDFTGTVTPSDRLDTWTARPQKVTAAGEKVPLKHPAEIVQLLADDQTHRVIREVSWPTRRHATNQIVTITLTRQSLGCRIEITSSLRGARGVRRMMHLALTPLQRLIMRSMLTQQIASLSRIFR